MASENSLPPVSTRTTWALRWRLSALFKSHPPVACAYAVHVLAPADAEHAEPYSQALIVALDGPGGTATLVCGVDVDEYDREMLLTLENAVPQEPGGLLHEFIRSLLKQTREVS